MKRLNHPRPLAVSVLATLAFSLVAVLPTASSVAAPMTDATPALAVPGTASALSPTAVQELLAGASVGSRGISPSELEVPRLAKVLATLPVIKDISGLSGLGGSGGLETALRQSVEKLLVGERKLGEVLSAKELSHELVGRLNAILGEPVEPLIKTLFGGEGTEAVLARGLGSTDLSELLTRVLAGAEHPTQLTDGLLQALEPARLKTILGSALSGEPVQNLNVGEVARDIGQTPVALAQALGQTAATLPETASAATGLLNGGDTLGLLLGKEGLALALLSKATEVVGSEAPVQGGGSTGGTGAGGGVGGSGANGGGAASGAAGSTGAAGPAGSSVLINSPTSPAAASNVGRVKILSRKVRRGSVTLQLQVPSAGTLKLTGKGLKIVTRKVATAGRVTLRIALTKARAASLHGHHRRTKVKLSASFLPVCRCALLGYDEGVLALTLRAGMGSCWGTTEIVSQPRGCANAEDVHSESLTIRWLTDPLSGGGIAQLSPEVLSLL
jgi:hypothetical protein